MGSQFWRIQKNLFVSRTRQNEDYWVMSPQDKVAHYLTKLFNNSHYNMILKFMGKRLVFNLSHIHDLWQQDANNNYNPIVWFTNDGPLILVVVV